MQIIGLMIFSLVALSLFTFQNNLINIFNPKEESRKFVEESTWIVAAIVIPDAYKALLKGVFRALGIQKYGVYINLVGHWSIGLTMQITFCIYLNWRLSGLWFGKLIFEFLLVSAYTAVLIAVDW